MAQGTKLTKIISVCKIKFICKMKSSYYMMTCEFEFFGHGLRRRLETGPRERPKENLAIITKGFKKALLFCKKVREPCPRPPFVGGPVGYYQSCIDVNCKFDRFYHLYWYILSAKFMEVVSFYVYFYIVVKQPQVLVDDRLVY